MFQTDNYLVVFNHSLKNDRGQRGTGVSIFDKDEKDQPLVTGATFCSFDDVFNKARGRLQALRNTHEEHRFTVDWAEIFDGLFENCKQ